MKQSKAKAFMAINEVHGVFVDALLTDDADALVFVSIWGHDTAVRELQGRLTLGANEGGLSAFNVLDQDSRRRYIRIANPDELEQLTGRVRTDILGELVHLWLFRREILKPDLANHRAMLISRNGVADNEWQAVKTVSPVPLLDHWADHLLPLLRRSGMITAFEGINHHGTRIAINEEEMALLVKQECRDGHLSV